MEVPFLRIGNLNFYNFMIILAITLGGIYLILQKQYTIKQKIVVIITTIISGFVGARLFYAIVNYKTVKMYQVFSTTFSYFKGYGAFIFAFINIVVLSKIYKIKLTKTLEPMLVWFYIGGALSKIGCFFTGCCKGVPTSLPWGVYRKYDIVKVHPSELYDCGAFIFSLFLLGILKLIKVKDTSRMAISLMSYIILRGIIEGTYYNGIIFGNKVSRIVYIITIIFCIGIVIKDCLESYRTKYLAKNKRSAD